MKNDELKLIKTKIQKSFEDNLKIHIGLKDKTWRNGYVKRIKKHFFEFYDGKNGYENFFYVEVFNVEPFMKEKLEEGKL